MAGGTHRNTTFDELSIGATAAIERTVTAHDLYVFAHASGNTNPVHRPGRDDDHDGRDDAVAPGMFVAALVSTVLGTVLPGAGTLYRGQTLDFAGRARLGDRLIVSVTLVEKRATPVAVFETTVRTTAGETILTGRATVEAPTTRIVLEASELPLLLLDEHDHFGKLIARCAPLPATPTAVVCPDDKNSLGGAILSAKENLIAPILIGVRARILAAADTLGADISAFEIIEEADPHAAAARAVALVHAGRARCVMKGNIHSDELLAEIVKRDGGLRTKRRLSHVFVMDVPTLDHLLFISDAAINIAPDLTAKVDITQNAIDVARACGLEKPKVGILAAVETVNVAMPSTLDAAALSKMAERGQIKGGLVDGPLAMDNAMDMEAAKTKGIASLVAGRAEVLIVPNLEAGNMLAKELTFVARAEAAGIVAGAKVPVILTSRADRDRARLASAAIAQLHDYWMEHGEALTDGAPPLAAAAE
jgi:phosphotransacetylase/acyl dehydratase